MSFFAAMPTWWVIFGFLPLLWTWLPWIQNVAEPRQNGRVGKVLELGDPRFHAAIAAIWNAIAVLERFCRSATETEIATETAF